MNVSTMAILLLGAFLWFWPQRKRNVLVQRLYDDFRHWPARIGLHHTAWTMFASGTNRNHFLKLRLQSMSSEPDPAEPQVAIIEVNTIEVERLVQDARTCDVPRNVEIRDPWKRGGVWGELSDERLRRIVLAVIRSDTGPNTKQQLAQGLVQWCLTHRIRMPSDELAGTAIYGQEVFRVPSVTDPLESPPADLVKFTVPMKRGRDGRLVIESSTR